MKTPSTQHVITIVFIIFATALFIKEMYGYAVLLLFGLLVIVKLDELTDFTLNLKGGFTAKFKITEEKIEEDIKENNQNPTRQKFIRFQNIESKILAEQQKKYGNEMKTLIHFAYGTPDNPEFIYTPDGSLQTDDTLYFFEIKYIIDPRLAKNIIERATKYLETVYKAFASSTEKTLIMKLIVASGKDIDLDVFAVPEGIEMEFIKI